MYRLAVTSRADSRSLSVRYWWHASVENISESASGIFGNVLFMSCFVLGSVGLWCFVLVFLGIMRFHLKLSKTIVFKIISLNPHITLELFRGILFLSGVLRCV